MFEYTNDFFQQALSVSSLVFGAAYCCKNTDGTSALHYYETQQAIALIEEFAELENGWAGPGSLAPSRLIREIATAAILTPKFLRTVPDISAMPNGTIAFDWDTQVGSANLEIGADDFSFYLDLDGAFFPLSGSSKMLPVLEISEIISYCLFPATSVPRTRPISYSERSGMAAPAYA